MDRTMRYSEDNHCLEGLYVCPSMKITLNNQTDVVAGVGLGLRFMVLGYFVLDYAWGIENYKVNKGLLYFLKFRFLI